MKITKKELKRIIQEELTKVLKKGEPRPFPQNLYRTGRPRRHRQAYEDPITYEGSPTDIYGNIKQPGVDYTHQDFAPTEAGRQGLVVEPFPSTYQGATTMAFAPHRALPGYQEPWGKANWDTGLYRDTPYGQHSTVPYHEWYPARPPLGSWLHWPTGIPGPEDYREYNIPPLDPVTGEPVPIEKK